MLCAIGVAGLRPAGVPAANRAHWDSARTLRLEPPSQLLSAGEVSLSPGAFAVEAWIEPGWPVAPGTNQEIFSLIDGAGAPALLVGQWPGGFLLRVRDDNPGGDPRRDRYVHHTIADRLVHLAIEVGPERLRFRVNGRPTDFSWRSGRRPEAGGFRGRVLLGSRATGWPAWRGAVHALFLREGPLPAGAFEAGVGEAPPVPRGHGTELASPSLRAAWRFDGLRSGPVACLAGSCSEMLVPEHAIDPAPPLLGLRVHPNRPGRWLPADVLLNVLGFAPLGFLLARLLEPSSGASRSETGRSAVAWATVLGLALSAAIELAQWWMPARNSSAIDLACNGAGSALGAWAAHRPARRGRAGEASAGAKPAT